jgi:hypothetical protein
MQLQQPSDNAPQNSQQIAAEQQNILGQLQTEKEAGARAQSDIDVRKAQGEQQIADSQATQARDLQSKRQADTRDFGAFVPTQENGSDLMKMFSMVAALGFMSGGHGRGAGLSAMKNMTAALQGHREGRQDTFNRELTEFKENMAAAKAHNDNVDKLYREGMGLLSTDRDAAIAKLKVAATIDGRDSALPHMIKSGNLEQAYKLLDDRRKATEKLEQHREQMQEQFRMRKAILEIQNAMKGGSGGGLSEEAKQMAAEVYRKTGQLPPGMGTAATAIRTEIINRAAKMNGSADDMLKDRAQYKATQGSLNAMMKSYDAVTAFEKTAIRNGDRLLQLADKVDKTGMPVIEKWIRSGRQATGDADVAAFNAQMQVYRTEAAKILTNPNLTGQLTDSARHEVENFLSGGASAQQIRAVVNLLKTDFENRRHTLEEQINEARSRLTESGDVGPKVAAPAVGPYSDQEKEQRYQAWKKSHGYQ